MIDSELELEIIMLKLKAAEANKLSSYRDELIETFDKLNLIIPAQIKSNIETSAKLDNNEIQEQIQRITSKNVTLQNELQLFKKKVDELEMIKMENFMLRKDFESKTKNPNETISFRKYLKELNERLAKLDYEKTQLQDSLINRDCKIDVMLSKLSHIMFQLQEPIQELRLKEKNGRLLTDEEKGLLKVAEMSVLNNKLKTRIYELKHLNAGLHEQYNQLKKKNLQYLKKQSTKFRENYKPIEDLDYLSPGSTAPPSVSSSYSMDIYKAVEDNPLAVAVLGLNSSEVTKISEKLKILKNQNQQNENFNCSTEKCQIFVTLT